MVDIQRNLDRTLSTLEHGLNIAGYIPVVSAVSGAARAVLGKIEVIGAIVVAAFTAIKALFSSSARAREAGLKQAVEILVNYSLHGISNIFRGALEIVPLLSLFTCLPYDLSSNRFTYPLEGDPIHLRERIAAFMR